MHILYYFWNENSADDIEDAFAALGHQCIRFSVPLKNYDSDLEFETQIDRFIQQHKIDLIYTFNYFPIFQALP